jgi:hypothetical protein
MWLPAPAFWLIIAVVFLLGLVTGAVVNSGTDSVTAQPYPGLPGPRDPCAEGHPECVYEIRQGGPT